MNHRTLELPESVYDGLLEAARHGGVTPADWIAERLPAESEVRLLGRDDEPALDRLLRHAGSIDLGSPTGTANEQIDADLAREYDDDHEMNP